MFIMKKKGKMDEIKVSIPQYYHSFSVFTTRLKSLATTVPDKTDTNTFNRQKRTTEKKIKNHEPES